MTKVLWPLAKPRPGRSGLPEPLRMTLSAELIAALAETAQRLPEVSRR